MRGLILVAGMSLSLCACGGGEDAGENAAGVDHNMTVDSAPAGDTTAIDATAGADANLAAGVEVANNAADSNETNASENGE